MIKLPNWLSDRRIKSIITQLEIKEVELFEWKNKTEQPELMSGQLLDKEEFNSILKGGVPIIKGKVQIFYIKDQYSPTLYKNTTSRFKYHLTTCGSITAAENSGRENRYVTTNKLSNVFSVNLLDSHGNVYSENANVKMNVCLSCLKKMASPKSSIKLTRPKRFRSNREWASNFDLKSYFNQAQNSLRDTTLTEKEKKNTVQQSLFKNNETTTNGPLDRIKTPESVYAVDISECSECSLAYPKQLRKRFKHFKTKDDNSICIKCYLNKYGRLPKGVTFQDRNIAVKALKQIIEPRYFKLLKAHNLNTDRIIFIGIVNEKNLKRAEIHPDVKSFIGNKPIKWFLDNNQHAIPLVDANKGNLIKLYSQELKILEVLQ